MGRYLDKIKQLERTLGQTARDMPVRPDHVLPVADTSNELDEINEITPAAARSIAGPHMQSAATRKQAQTTYVMRLRAGVAWLTTTEQKLGEMEVRLDIHSEHYKRLREAFLSQLDLWDVAEKQLRALFGYKGCVCGPGKRCPEDSPVTCSYCERKPT